MKNHKSLYLVAVAYFTLGLVNIHLALLGFLCILLPFVLLYRSGKKTWCQGYCPRASLFTALTRRRPWKSRRIPALIRDKDLHLFVLIYFGINIFFIIMSTLAVASGRMYPMEYLRFYIMIPLPGPLPNLLDWAPEISWLTHLSYRVYSMMFTSTVIGFVLAWIYRPRTWCVICPVGNLSNRALVRK